MTGRRMPVPMTFAVVVAAIIFLIIFFGAWAVSADTEGRGRALSFGFAGTTGLESQNLNAQASADGQGELASDSWWGGAFLKACPFH